MLQMLQQTKIPSNNKIFIGVNIHKILRADHDCYFASTRYTRNTEFQ